MKKIIFGSTLVCAMALGVFSCSKDFLDTKPTASNNNVSLANDKGVNALLIGAYHAFVGGVHQDGWHGDWSWSGSITNWVWGSVASDDGTKGSDITDQSTIVPVEDFTVDASNGYVSDKWNYDYEAIGRANDVLKVMALATDITPENAAYYKAQALFLRGLFHFELKRVFNNIPYITEDVVDPATVPNNTDTWPMIEADLQFAIDNLPESQTDPGRPTKYAAEALLARVHLFQHDYAAAKTLLDDILNSEKYSLMPNYDDNYLIAKRNNAESIFEIQYAVNDGTNESVNGNYGDALNYPQNVDGTNTCCGFHQPTQNFVNAFKTDANGLPMLDDFNETNLKNDMGIASEEEFIPSTETVDPRLDHTVGRRGIPFLDWGIFRGKAWIRDQGNAGPYVYKKNMFKKSEQNSFSTTTGWATGINSNNYRMIRLAHVMLWRAEVAVEENDLETALNLVNEIRERAANHVVMGLCTTYVLPSQSKPDADPPFILAVDENAPAANYLVNPYPSFADQETARKAVRHEQRLEFGMEGYRFADLVRWGIAAETMNAYMVKDRAFRSLFGGATPKSFTEGRNEYWPIPQTQIDLQGSDILTQNPGY